MLHGTRAQKAKGGRSAVLFADKPVPDAHFGRDKARRRRLVAKLTPQGRHDHAQRLVAVSRRITPDLALDEPVRQRLAAILHHDDKQAVFVRRQ